MHQKNFFCISSFNADLDWFKDFDYPHVIYDKCYEGIKKSTHYPFEIKPSNLKSKYPYFNIINGEIEGYNLNDYLTYIIENYYSLPEIIIFIKGNILKRHVSKKYFERVVDNKYFTSIEDWVDNKKLKLNSKNYFISSDGGWVERNNNWYLNNSKHPTKFFNNYDTFMKFIFKSYIKPRYIRFCPGANYIVPKANILKYGISFYKNLKFIINHSQLSGESHILERSLYSIWNSSYEASDIMKETFSQFIKFPNKDNLFKVSLRKIISKVL